MRFFRVKLVFRQGFRLLRLLPAVVMFLHQLRVALGVDHGEALGFGIVSRQTESAPRFVDRARVPALFPIGSHAPFGSAFEISHRELAALEAALFGLVRFRELALELQLGLHASYDLPFRRLHSLLSHREGARSRGDLRSTRSLEKVERISTRHDAFIIAQPRRSYQERCV
jgi:hypothetical protein